MLIRHYQSDKYRTLCCLPIGTCEITIISTLVTCNQCKEMLKKKGIPIKDNCQDCACGRPAKYIYQPVNVAGDPLCGIHARRFKDSGNLRPINVKLNSK